MLRDLIALHGVKAVFVEGVTPENVKRFRFRVQELRDIDASDLQQSRWRVGISGETGFWKATCHTAALQKLTTREKLTLLELITLLRKSHPRIALRIGTPGATLSILAERG